MVPFVVKKTKDERFHHLYNMIMIFTIGCFIGVVYETIYCYFQFGQFQSRRGLIYGPFNPVYGVGTVVMVEFLQDKKSLLSLFVRGFFLGGVVEYLCSWVQETVFLSTSWDYSQYFLNFDGRTSVFHMIGWGLTGMIFMAYLYPILVKLLDRIPMNKRRFLVSFLVLFFSIDSFISGYANIRQEERNAGVEATTGIQKFFDKHYPDELLNKVYPKKKSIIKKKKANNVVNFLS